MTAVVSTTYDSKYLFFLPIITWCWHKLGVNVFCTMPYLDGEFANEKMDCINDALSKVGLAPTYSGFDAPEHKRATYAQCSRLYAACSGTFYQNEYLISSDIDMALFKLPITNFVDEKFQILGTDLVPQWQYPVCYCGATVKVWREVFNLKGKYFQQCLDELLGDIECENMRGNYWGKDQEELWNKISQTERVELPRARPGTQFASNRYDRDDAYLLDRLSLDTIDYHMPRPGYEEKAFNQIMTVLKFHYPYDDFAWLENYRTEYMKLL